MNGRLSKVRRRLCIRAGTARIALALAAACASAVAGPPAVLKIFDSPSTDPWLLALSLLRLPVSPDSHPFPHPAWYPGRQSDARQPAAAFTARPESAPSPASAQSLGFPALPLLVAFLEPGAVPWSRPARPIAPPDLPRGVGRNPPKPAPESTSPPAELRFPAPVSLTRALGLDVRRVVIDAGHGGHDEGASGPRGLFEKDVALDVALRTARLAARALGVEVILTREDDSFVPLGRRTSIANERGADLFLSIHANSAPSPETAGTETFFLNFNTNPSALAVALRENAGFGKPARSLPDLVRTIALSDKAAESETFAESLQAALSSVADRRNAARNRGVKRAPFAVLIGAQMPSALAEIGFLSNPEEESNLARPEYRQEIAVALSDGLARYVHSLNVPAPPVHSVGVFPRRVRRVAESRTARRLRPKLTAGQGAL